MSMFFEAKLKEKLREVPDCGPCGDRPRCEDMLQAIMESIPMNRGEDGELRPVTPRDPFVLNFCMDAVVRVAMCMAERGKIEPFIPKPLDSPPDYETIG